MKGKCGVKIRRILALWGLMFFVGVDISMAYEVLSMWETAIEKDDVKIQYRWIYDDYAGKTRQMKVSFNVIADAHVVLESLMDQKKYADWSNQVKKCEIDHLSENEWVNYSQYNIPRPLKQRDIIVKHSLTKNGSYISISMKSLPEYMAYQSDNNRIEGYKGEWKMYTNSKGTTHVVFESYCKTKTSLPRVVQDPIVQRMMINSFSNLIKMCENETSI